MAGTAGYDRRVLVQAEPVSAVEDRTMRSHPRFGMLPGLPGFRCENLNP